MRRFLLIFLFSVIFVEPSIAADDKPCPEGMVCASKPASLIEVIQAEGYKAKLTKDEREEPMIESAAAGYNFVVFFYGCELKEACSSIQFSVSFTEDARLTPALVNDWNSENRFSKIYIGEKGKINLRYDVSTIGGISKANFVEVVDLWNFTLNSFGTFADKHLPEKKAK